MLELIFQFIFEVLFACFVEFFSRVLDWTDEYPRLKRYCFCLYFLGFGKKHVQKVYTKKNKFLIRERDMMPQGESASKRSRRCVGEGWLGFARERDKNS